MDGGSLMDSMTMSVVEPGSGGQPVITSGDEIEANGFALWDTDDDAEWPGGNESDRGLFTD